MAGRPPDPPGIDPASTDRQTAIDDTGRIDQTRPLPQAPVQPPIQPPARRSPQPPVAGNMPAPQAPRPRTRAAVAPPYPPQQAVPRTSAVPRRSPASSGWYLPWWSLVVLVLAVGAIALLLVFALAEFSAPNTPGNQPAQVRVVTSVPTLSQDFFDSSSRNVAPTSAAPINVPGGQAVVPPLPTAAPSPSLPPGDFRIGAAVRVVGVGLNGLNVRSDPGTGSSSRFLAFDDDEFVLVDGPQSVNNLQWWRIEDPDDDDRYGWAARNYLEIVAP